jgi:hypothetical protein
MLKDVYMRRRYMVWTGNFLAFAVLAFGVWMLVGYMPAIPSHKLLCGIAALTGILWNHLRWRKIVDSIGDPDIAGKIDHLIVAHNMVLLLAFALLDFHR